MSTHLFIITGASRGLGLRIAEQLTEPHHHLLCISRTAPVALSGLAAEPGTHLTHWCADLSDPEPVANRLQHWLEELDFSKLHSVTLINNAGVIPPIAPLRASDPKALSQALRVGLEAPMLLTHAFLAATARWHAQRKVLNISSGLGHRPMASQSAYCAAKAGLDHFTRCLALDEAAVPHGARVCSLAPGVIDTDMQMQLRSASPETFPDQAGFEQLKRKGQLSAPQDTAKRILAYLNHPDFGNFPVADIREVATS